MSYYPPQGIGVWGYGIHPPQGIRVPPVVVPTLSKVTSGKILFDDFLGTTIDTTIWDVQDPGAASVANSWLTVTADGALPHFAIVTKNTAIADAAGVVVEALMRIIGVIGAGNQQTYFYILGDTLADPDVRSHGTWRQEFRYDTGDINLTRTEDTTLVSKANAAETYPLPWLRHIRMQVKDDGATFKYWEDYALKFDVSTTPIARTGTVIWYVLYNMSAEIDYVKIYKDVIVKVTGLLEGQKVELYDATDTLVATATVPVGQTVASLDLSTKAIPVNGYFKVYKTDGVTLWYRYPKTGTVEIWGGDEYQQV